MLFLFVLFWHSVHMQILLFFSLPKKLPPVWESEVNGEGTWGRQGGLSGLSSGASPDIHRAHADLHTSLAQISTTPVRFPKELLLPVPPKDTSSNTPFPSAAKFTFYSFLSSLILGRVWTEVCLLKSTWWEQQARSTAAAKRSAQTAVPQHSSFQPNHPRE